MGDVLTADCSGYATKAGLKCSDGRTIMPDAFKHQDGQKVPLVWAHTHNDPDMVLGHAILEHRDGNTYSHLFFNDTAKGQSAKALVEHGDVDSLSIFANKLVEKSKEVWHGFIKEVSLVLAGANPGAKIDYVAVQHSDDPNDITIVDDEAVIYTGLPLLKHGEQDETKDEAPADSEGEALEHEEDGKTVQEILDTLSQEQRDVVDYIVGEALAGNSEGADDSSAEHSDNNDEGDLSHQEGNDDMSRNIFERGSQDQGSTRTAEQRTLSHDEFNEIKENWKRGGSMKQAVEDFALAHGIENLELLFPDPKTIGEPEFDARRMEWVSGVIDGVRRSPFSRIKTLYADITHDKARALGYIKGNLKKEEFFGLKKRTTGPTTVYKKQKLDRDDILDATEINVVAWMKAEMQMMLKEEIARAILIGDGRPTEDPANPGEPNPDKIKDPAGVQDGTGIRSILNDHELYAATVNVNVSDANSDYNEVIDRIIESRSLYKGSGTPTFYTTTVHLTKMLLLRDGDGRRLYKTVADLAAELRVDKIVEVEVMEEQEPDLIGIIVNLSDYNVGTDKGGEVTLFDDFDIDYNQFKYLIETRFSGALVKIRSALIIKSVAAALVEVTPNELAFDPGTNTIDYVAQTGVVYSLTPGGAALAADVVITEDTVVYARPAAGYFFPNNVEDEFFYEFQA